MTSYPTTYHAAVGHIIAYGAAIPSQPCRDNLAHALQWLRVRYGAERARAERGHILYISGHFPDKERAITGVK